MEGNDPLRGHDPATQLSGARSGDRAGFCTESLGRGGAERDRLKSGCGRPAISAPQPYVLSELGNPIRPFSPLSVPLRVARCVRDRNSERRGWWEGCVRGNE